MEALEGFRGLIDAQEASAANLPVTQAARTGKVDLLIDTGGQQWTPEQAKELEKVLDGTGFSPTATNRGVLALNFAEGNLKGLRGNARKKAQEKAERTALSKLQKKADEIRQIFPGATITPAGREGVYVPGLGPKQGTGEYTSEVLEGFARSTDHFTRNIAESERVRSVITDKMLRDAGSKLTREDLQKTRKFFAEADWARLVDLIRHGAKPAAAAAFLGYSLQGLAEED